MNEFNPPEPEILKDFIYSIKQKLYNKPLVITDLEYPVLFIGDIHGFYDNVTDAFKVAKENGVKSIVFMGDYVDRGDPPSQLRALLNVMYFFAQSYGLHKRFPFVDNHFPNNRNIDEDIKIVALRGNHENADINKNYGFYEILSSLYPNNNEIIDEVLSLYKYLPISAITSQGTIAMHGGIPKIDEIFGTTFLDLFKKAKVPYPRNDFEKYSSELMKIIEQILWNDPDSDNKDEIPRYLESLRSEKYYIFNEAALNSFLNINGFRRLVRSHESTRGAYEIMWDGKIIHVFSTYPYFDYTKTPAYFLEFSDGSGRIIDDKNEPLEPINQISI